MSYMPSPQAPKVSPAQAARNDRWFAWQREQQRISREALECFNAGDYAGALALQEQGKALPEPDIFNG